MTVTIISKLPHGDCQGTVKLLNEATLCRNVGPREQMEKNFIQYKR